MTAGRTAPAGGADGRRSTAQRPAAGQPAVSTAKVAQDSTTARKRPGSGAQTRWAFPVPYPPSTNALYATVQGRRVKTKAAREFAAVVGDMASIVRVRASGSPEPPYRLTILLWAPDRRRRDADNGVKCLQDALLKATGHDDAEVVELIVRKLGVDPVYPRAEVTLEHVEA